MNKGVRIEKCVSSEGNKTISVIGIFSLSFLRLSGLANSDDGIGYRD